MVLRTGGEVVGHVLPGRAAQAGTQAMSGRVAGLIAHPTSLPSHFGIGDFGAGTTGFLAWAAAAGQSVWQILPLGPTTDSNSPYGCLSTFAGNPLLISPTELLEDGLLPPSALKMLPDFPADRVDFAPVIAFKQALLRKSWQHFRRHAPPLARLELEGFVSDAAQQCWLADWSLFMVLKDAHGGAPWQAWERDLRQREPAALATARAELADEVAYHTFIQFLFFRQWRRLRDEAHRLGIRILGDLPIYVAPDSADVWASSEYFDLDVDGNPLKVAGVPPDYFSATGQRWGNPLYRWDRLEQDGFGWWVARMRAALALTDLVRIDHFRGFAGYWEVPASEPTAVSGRWVPGPGLELFTALRRALGELPIVAEDLGVITPDVVELRRALGAPGMRVMQFGFGGLNGDHLPHNWEVATAGYTGTHDNDTTRGWFAKASSQEQARALDYLGGEAETIEWEMIRALYTSVASLAIVPLQDTFSLGSEARMNTPAEAHGNWGWRARRELFRPELARRLRRLAELSGRAAPL
ncbi:MAG: 4-alpha-glucanotransferase [Acidobacteriota bacterium]